ncbi:MAG: CerR family C-terminal domain-containing protein [Planctomycetota bacterium]
MKRARLEAIAAVVDEAEANGDLELLLRAFSEAFYQPMMEPGRGQLLFMIFMRELTDPQLDPGVLAEKMVRPTQGAMVEALMRVVPGLGAERAVVCFRLLVGQLVHLVQIWTMARRLGDRELAPFEVNEMVDHIVRFTVGGIGAYRDEIGSEGD